MDVTLSPNVDFNTGTLGSNLVHAKLAKCSYQSELDRKCASSILMSEYLEDQAEKCRSYVAHALNTEEQDIILSQDTTSCLRTAFDILYNLKRIGKRRNEVLLSSIEHDSLKNLIEVSTEYELTIRYVPLDDLYYQNGTSEQILSRFCEQIKRDTDEKTKIIVLSHIPYCGGKLPVDKIIKNIKDLIRSREIFFVVDGAHAYGQEKIDVKKINCDFYASGSHKFGLAPKLGFLGTRIEYLKELSAGKYRLPIFNSFSVTKELRKYVVKGGSRIRELELGTIDGSSIVGYNAAYEHLFENYGISRINKKIAHLREYFYDKARERFRVLCLEEVLGSGIISLEIRHRTLKIKEYVI